MSKQEVLLENKIRKMINESLFEHGLMWEEEPKEKKHKEKHKKHSKDKEDKEGHSNNQKRKDVLDLLTATEDNGTASFFTNHADIAKELWPDEEPDSSRSKFSKKLNGVENDNGSPYSFSDEEINKLYNIMSQFD